RDVHQHRRIFRARDADRVAIALPMIDDPKSFRTEASAQLGQRLNDRVVFRVVFHGGALVLLPTRPFYQTEPIPATNFAIVRANQTGGDSKEWASPFLKKESCLSPPSYSAACSEWPSRPMKAKWPR